jgi:hypothetical protein
MEIAALTAFLAPFVAPLLAKTQEAAADAVQQFGEAAWDQAQQLWQRIGDRVFERPAAKEAVEDVAKAPDDPRATSALELQLEKILSADPGLRDELAKIWQAGQAAGITIAAIGERSFAAQNVTNSTVTTGDTHGAGAATDKPGPKAP